MVRRHLDEGTRQPRNWGLFLLLGLCAEFWVVVAKVVTEQL